MSNISFRIMSFLFKIYDLFHDPEKRTSSFDIKKGETIIDYGCGPGRYTRKLSELVGEKGKVYCVDVQKLAIDAINKKIVRYNLKNVIPVLANDNSNSLKSNIADKILVLDMFHMVKNPSAFLKELHRLLKKDGILIIEDGHQPRKITKKNILDSRLWKIIEENKYHLKCKKL